MSWSGVVNGEVVEFIPNPDGSPSDAQIQDMYRWETPALLNHLAIRHECPRCGSRRTAWAEHEWCVCYNCLIPFTVEEALDYKEFIEERI